LKSQELKAHQATNKEELIKNTDEALKRMAKRPALKILKRPIQGRKKGMIGRSLLGSIGRL